MLALLNHLWQSTLFAAAIALLALSLRKNRASVRHSLWLAASVKFLVPFSLFVAIGQQIDFRAAPSAAAAQVTTVVEQFGQPFTLTLAPSQPAPNGPSRWPAIPLSIWACGFALCLVTWINRWRSLRRILRTATRLPLQLPIHVLSSPARLEPGVFGIFRPVLLLPENIRDRLTPAQFHAILAHELTHLRRRDNLAAAIHMLVEAIFWFHPLVWWIEHRMVEERERACDEAVLRATGKPEAYASGILEVCRLYLESPLTCVAGVTGSDLKRRITAIMHNPAARKLSIAGTLLLASAALVTVAVPILIGAAVRAQNTAEPHLAFEVASVKPSHSGATRAPSMILPGGRFKATNNTLRALILNAYGISATPYLLSGGPGWIDSERYDVDARADSATIPGSLQGNQLWDKTRLMLRTLLADRFHLVIRRETKEMPVYQLVLARNGPILKTSDQDCAASTTACHGFSGNPTRLSGIAVDMSDLALLLSSYSDRPVLDKTGIQGRFDIRLQWNPFLARPSSSDDAPRAPGAVSREGPSSDPDSLPTLFTALEQQLGLKLESRKAPVETYVVERVEKPSAN